MAKSIELKFPLKKQKLKPRPSNLNPVAPPVARFTSVPPIVIVDPGETI